MTKPASCPPSAGGGGRPLDWTLDPWATAVSPDPGGLVWLLQPRSSSTPVAGRLLAPIRCRGTASPRITARSGFLAARRGPSQAPTDQPPGVQTHFACKPTQNAPELTSDSRRSEARQAGVCFLVVECRSSGVGRGHRWADIPRRVFHLDGVIGMLLSGFQSASPAARAVGTELQTLECGAPIEQHKSGPVVPVAPASTPSRVASQSPTCDDPAPVA